MITNILTSLLFAVLPLAVLAGIIGAAIAARQQREEAEPEEPGIGTVRRLFVYVLALVGLVFAAIGVSLLISGALQVAFEQVIVSERSQQLSTALAFTIVGTPAWLIFALLAQRSVAQHPVEAYSTARRLYFAVVRGVALVIVAVNAITVGHQVVGVEPLSSDGWGWLLTWGGVWLVHQRLIAGERAPSLVTRLLERLYGYFGSILGLALLLGSIASVVSVPLEAVYDRFTGVSLVDRALDVGLREGLVVLVVGGLIWAWHWLRDLLRRDRLMTLWYVQVFVAGTLPGVALTVVPVAVLLYTTLEWYVGTPEVERASAQFREVPSLLGALVAGVATWGYHRSLLREARGAALQSEPERVYRYLVAAAGLVASAVGLATVIALAFDALGGDARSLVRASGWWRDPLIRAFTLLVVGTPLWAWYWSRLQLVALREEATARASLSRRAFLFAAVGVSLISLLVALVVLLFQVFQPILDGDVSREVLRDARWSVATTVTSALIAVYYLLVLREDQAALQAAGAVAPAAPVRRRDVVLLAPDGANAAEALRGIEGVRLRWWLRTDEARGAPLPAEQVEALRAQVAGSEAAQVVVVVSGAGFEVVPYREARE